MRQYLKIKNEVELKDLEKFGLKRMDYFDGSCYEYCGFSVSVGSRRIVCDGLDKINDTIVCKLYELISSGYVTMTKEIRLDNFQKSCLRKYKENYGAVTIARDLDGELIALCKKESVTINEDITRYPISNDDGLLEIDDLINSEV